MLKGEWENHKPLSKAKEGEESFGCLQEGPQQSTGTKWVSAPSPSKTSFLAWRKSSYLVTWVPLPAVHLLYKPPLWNHQHDHIHLYSLEQNKVDSGFSVQGRLKPPLQTRLSPKQRGACKNSLLHVFHTPTQKHQHTAVLWYICTAGANQLLTPPAVTGNAKWGADGWAGNRSNNQS